jgi:ABC-type uncharacterized transport system substrate-binding protein
MFLPPMIRTIRTALAAFAALAMSAVAAQAHPHVWITMTSMVIYAPDGTVTGIRHAWTFDDMFSTFATQGLDSKQKGVFTREELQPLAEVNVTSLKEYEYFNYAKVDGKKAEFVDPVDYHLELKDSLLTLHFTLPLKAPIKAQTLDVEVYDPSYFIDFSYAEKDGIVLKGAPAACKGMLNRPQEMNKELADRLSKIGPNEKIPENSFGAQFANKLTEKCS